LLTARRISPTINDGLGERTIGPEEFGGIFQEFALLRPNERFELTQEVDCDEDFEAATVYRRFRNISGTARPAAYGKPFDFAVITTTVNASKSPNAKWFLGGYELARIMLHADLLRAGYFNFSHHHLREEDLVLDFLLAEESRLLAAMLFWPLGAIRREVQKKGWGTRGGIIHEMARYAREHYIQDEANGLPSDETVKKYAGLFIKRLQRFLPESYSVLMEGVESVVPRIQKPVSDS